MGKLFGKKGDGEEDSNRSALFGSRKKDSKTSNSQSQNPYANLPTQSDAYNAAKAKAGVPGYMQRGSSPAPPPKQGGYPDEKKAGYGTGMDNTASRNGPAYGADPYRAQTGYGGDDRYGSKNGASQPDTGRSRAGGYGGLGAAPEEDRDNLFAGAKDRVQKQSQQQRGYGAPPAYDDGQPSDTGYGESSAPDYGAYGDRQLTAEEEEEEDVAATKQQMRFMKREDVSSTRNALRIAAQAEETGMNTLARIGAQGERIHNTEKNLDLTANHNRSAEDKAKELKKLNRSMFAVHVSNPFTASSRAQQADMDVLERHAMEREQRGQSRREVYASNSRMKGTFQDISKQDQSKPGQQSSLADRAKFQFEADSEDDELENEIDGNLDALGGVAGRLNGLARATGKEVEEQNRHLERINQKSTKVDDQIALNRARLDRFH